MVLVSFESLVERTFIFFPSRGLLNTPRHLGLPFQDLFFTTADGIKLHAWYLPGSPAAPVLLWCHGNGGNLSYELDNLALLHGADFGIFIFDYRGYGLSQGRPSEAGVYRDARAAYQYLRESLGIPPNRIVLFGRSLGGAVAMELAEQVPARALIVESAFTSVGDMARHHYPWLPGQKRWAHKFDNVRRVARLTLPKLFIYGDSDLVVPIWMGERLHDLAPAPKAFYRIPGAGHEDTLEVGGPAYLQRLKDFLEQSP
jgi:fermentation-respiration switch protein FrsA (DUF1100 family)